MNFKTRKINHDPKPPQSFKKNKIGTKPPKKNLPPIKRWLTLSSLLLVSIIIIFGGLYIVFSQLSLKQLVLSLGQQLETDYENRTNFLLLGTGVQGINDASTLTDTIIVASYNHNNDEVTLLSVPRDLYIETPAIGGSRINQIYETTKSKYNAEKGISVLQEEIEKLSGLNIHYYAKINFNGLKQIVDSLGGVEINVENAIYDPHYPKDGTIYYEPFRISKGLQLLDGDTALKYARSRKTTSDFDRSRRQQKLIFAIKEKAMKRDILTSPSKLESLFSAVSDNLETDLSIREIIELAKLGQDIKRDQIATFVLNNDPTQCGGFLYNPDRDLFGGAYVLIPIGGSKTDRYKYIHQFVDIILQTGGHNKTPIQVLNGTKTGGLAGEVKMKLQRYCFNVTRFGNAYNQKLENTTIYYKGENPPSELPIINQLVKGEISSEIPQEYKTPAYQSNAQIIIELGKEYATNERDDFLRYIYTPQPAIKSEEPSESTEETENTTNE